MYVYSFCVYFLKLIFCFLKFIIFVLIFKMFPLYSVYLSPIFYSQTDLISIIMTQTIISVSVWAVLMISETILNSILTV